MNMRDHSRGGTWIGRMSLRFSRATTSARHFEYLDGFMAAWFLAAVEAQHSGAEQSFSFIGSMEAAV